MTSIDTMAQRARQRRIRHGHTNPNYADGFTDAYEQMCSQANTPTERQARRRVGDVPGGREVTAFTRTGHVEPGTITDHGWATDVERDPITLDGHCLAVVERTSTLLGIQTLLVDASGALHQVGDADATGRRHVWSLESGQPLTLDGRPVDLFMAAGTVEAINRRQHR